jgi:long-chain fatty acid transport protein
LLALCKATGKLLAQSDHSGSWAVVRSEVVTNESRMRNRCNLSRLLVILISGISVWKVSANGFALPDQDAFATARGEAVVATANNPSAIYYNPAGITQLEGDNLRGGVYGIYLDPSYRPPSGAPNSGHTYYEQDNFAAVPQIFYTHTLKNLPLSFGLGIYAPFGGNTKWPQDTGFRTVAISGSLKYFTINPAVGWKILPSFSVGGGVMVNYVNMDMEQGLRPAFLPPNINFFRFSGDGWSVGYNLGLRWQPIDQISIGATFRSSAIVTLNGHTEFEQSSGGIPDTSLPAHAGFTFPLTAVLGISYRPTPKWNLEIDANYTDWSSFGKTTIYQSGITPLGGPQNPPLTLDWQASWMYEFGVTRYFDDGWHISAGYVFNENSVPNAFYTPLAADMDRDFFSIGAGRKGKTFDFDLAYQFGYGPAHTVTGSQPSSTPGFNAGQSADGKYGFNSSALMLTVGMHF